MVKLRLVGCALGSPVPPDTVNVQVGKVVMRVSVVAQFAWLAMAVSRVALSPLLVVILNLPLSFSVENARAVEPAVSPLGFRDVEPLMFPVTQLLVLRPKMKTGAVAVPY